MTESRAAGARRAAAAFQDRVSMHTLVDVDRLQSFTEGDAVLEAELIALFVQTADGYFAGLERALGDPDRWQALAHSLKGAASNIGAPALAAGAAAAEHTPPDPARLDAMRATFAATCRRLLAEREHAPLEAVTGPYPERIPNLSG